MKTKEKVTSLLAAGLLFFGTGCATRLADLTVVSTRNVSLNKVDLDRLPNVKSVTGTDSKFIFLFIPFGVPHLEDAVDDALNKGGGDVMTDAVVHMHGWWFLIGQNSLRVKGNVINTKGAAR